MKQMPTRLQREIDKLRKNILGLSALVEENLRNAVRSIEEKDVSLAKKVIHVDQEIDDIEVDLEEECLKLLALYQPVAFELRYIVAVLKINQCLERIGDMAVNIAERAECLSLYDMPIPFDLPAMAEIVQSMLRKSLDSLIHMKPEIAYKVCATDDKVDAINREMYLLVEEGIREDIEYTRPLINLLGISRYLERVADLAVNISEEVIYLVEGNIIRHRDKSCTTHNE